MSEEPEVYETGRDMTATEVLIRQVIAPIDFGLKSLRTQLDSLDALVTSSLKPTAPQYNLLFAALASAQGDIAAAEASQENTHFDYRYANLQDCLDACRKPLAENELAVIQLPTIVDGRVYVRTILGHSSGQLIEQTMDMKPDKEGPQAVGSCITYLRRYMLCAIVGIGQQDDDANLASKDPNDYERLSPEQIDEILVLADKHFKEDADAKVDRMLDKAFQVTVIGDIPADLFDSAINLLNNQAKREKAKAKKSAKNVDDATPPPDEK